MCGWHSITCVCFCFLVRCLERSHLFAGRGIISNGKQPSLPISIWPRKKVICSKEQTTTTFIVPTASPTDSDSCKTEPSLPISIPTASPTDSNSLVVRIPQPYYLQSPVYTVALLLPQIVKHYIVIRGHAFAARWVELYKYHHKKKIQKSNGIRKKLITDWNICTCPCIYIYSTCVYLISSYLSMHACILLSTFAC